MLKRWILPSKYKIGNSQEYTFIGRNLLTVSEPDKTALLSLGIFSEGQDGKLKYSGCAAVRGTDDIEYLVDQEGVVDIPDHVIPEGITELETIEE